LIYKKENKAGTAIKKNQKIKKFGRIDAYVFYRVESSGPGISLDSSSSSPTNVDLILALTRAPVGMHGILYFDT
jgi:hypothetical protein